MTLKDATVANKPDTSHSSHSPMAARSPYEVRVNQIDFSKFPVAANNVDQVNLIPLNPFEHVIACWIRLDTPSTNTGATVTLTDTRNSGAILASTDVSLATSQVTKAAGASVGVVPLLSANQIAGFLQLADSHATVALNNGLVTVFAIIGMGF